MPASSLGMSMSMMSVPRAAAAGASGSNNRGSTDAAARLVRFERVALSGGGRAAVITLLGSGQCARAIAYRLLLGAGGRDARAGVAPRAFVHT